MQLTVQCSAEKLREEASAVMSEQRTDLNGLSGYCGLNRNQCNTETYIREYVLKWIELAQVMVMDFVIILQVV